MTQIVRATAAVMMTILLVGCAGMEKEREAKREHDRTMMRLQDAERANAEMKVQVDQLKASLEASNAKTRDVQKDLSATQDSLRQAQAELGKSQSTAAASADLQNRLTALQTENQKLEADVKTLQQQLSAARDSAAKSTPVVTQPTMNK